MEAEYKKIVRGILGDRKLNVPQMIGYIKRKVPPANYRDALKMHPSFSYLLKQNAVFDSIDTIKQREVFQFTGDFKREFKGSKTTTLDSLMS